MHSSFLPPLGKEDAALSSRCSIQNHCLSFPSSLILWVCFLYCLLGNLYLDIRRNEMRLIPFELSLGAFFSLILLRFTSKLISRTSWSDLCNRWYRSVLVLKGFRIPFGQNFNNHKLFKYSRWDSILKPMKIRFNCPSN